MPRKALDVSRRVRLFRPYLPCNTLRERLAALQEEVNRCEIEINKAMQKTYAHLTVEDVEKYLLSKVFEDPDDIKVRKLLVNTFVREVIWYGDHMVITYNFQERFSTERFSKSYVEDIEKQVGECSRSASSFPLSSYKVTQSAPKKERRISFVICTPKVGQTFGGAYIYEKRKGI